MSILRKRMIEDMQLRGFSPRTQQSYSRAVRKLAQHYHKSPNLVTDEELRQYFLYRTNVSRWSRVACTIALCGIKFFYKQTLKRDWTTVGLVKPKRIKHQLPGHHFMITFTVPEQLRRFIRKNQRAAYSALFKASSYAIKKLTPDEKFIGGNLPGFLGVLLPWSSSAVSFSTSCPPAL